MSERSEMDEAAIVLRFPKYLSWISGSLDPTIKQLENFARFIRTPVGYLFLSEPPHSFVGSSDIHSDVVKTATEIRNAMGLDPTERRRYSTWTDALRVFISQADDFGILVMCSGVVLNNTHRALDPTEFRGFALSGPHAPLVFVNGADTKAAQMFTLAYEIAHLWLGISSLFDVSPESQSF